MAGMHFVRIHDSNLNARFQIAVIRIASNRSWQYGWAGGEAKGKAPASDNTSLYEVVAHRRHRFANDAGNFIDLVKRRDQGRCKPEDIAMGHGARD